MNRLISCDNGCDNGPQKLRANKDIKRLQTLSDDYHAYWVHGICNCWQSDRYTDRIFSSAISFVWSLQLASLQMLGKLANHSNVFVADLYINWIWFDVIVFVGIRISIFFFGITPLQALWQAESPRQLSTKIDTLSWVEVFETVICKLIH